MTVAREQVQRAWHIVRPDHPWCKIGINIPQNSVSNAIRNLSLVEDIIQRAWANGAIRQTVINDSAGYALVWKEMSYNGMVINIIARVMLGTSGVVNISNAWPAIN